MRGKASTNQPCPDCQDCGAQTPVDPVSLRPGVVLGVVGRRRRDRIRHRVCDVCGHGVRFHALDVAPSPESALSARLPDDLSSDGISWSDPPTRHPVDPTARP